MGMTVKYTRGHHNGAITYLARYISLPVSGFSDAFSGCGYYRTLTGCPWQTHWSALLYGHHSEVAKTASRPLPPRYSLSWLHRQTAIGEGRVV